MFFVFPNLPHPFPLPPNRSISCSYKWNRISFGECFCFGAGSCLSSVFHLFDHKSASAHYERPHSLCLLNGGERFFLFFFLKEETTSTRVISQSYNFRHEDGWDFFLFPWTWVCYWTSRHLLSGLVNLNCQRRARRDKKDITGNSNRFHLGNSHNMGSPTEPSMASLWQARGEVKPSFSAVVGDMLVGWKQLPWKTVHATRSK